MRRILKEIAAGGGVKTDTTTLENFFVVATLQPEEAAGGLPPWSRPWRCWARSPRLAAAGRRSLARMSSIK
jgi:hypothetical protein